MHPSSGGVIKRNLSDHFKSITYESGRLLDIVYDDSSRGELLSAVEGPFGRRYARETDPFDTDTRPVIT
jgi:hypothetical protein